MAALGGVFMAVKSSRSSKWKAQRLRVLNRDQWICFYCHGPANEADHIIAKVNGGDDSMENLVSCCRMCNLRKGRKPQGVFLAHASTPLSSRANRSPMGPIEPLIGPFSGQTKPVWQ